jgi:hypothetical protein
MWQGAEGDEHSHEVAEASASAYRDCTERPHGPDRLRAGTTPPLSSNPDPRLRPSHTAHLCYGSKAETTTQQRMARTTHGAVNRKAPNDGKRTKETGMGGRIEGEMQPGAAYRDCSEPARGPDRLRAGTTPPLSLSPDPRLAPSHNTRLCAAHNNEREHGR